jgi:hypothetical protein
MQNCHHVLTLPEGFSIKTRNQKDNGEIKLYSTRWRVDTIVLSSLQPDSVVQVKVYNELVFPTIDGAILFCNLYRGNKVNYLSRMKFNKLTVKIS